MTTLRIDADSQNRSSNWNAGRSLQDNTEKRPVILAVDDDAAILKLLRINLTVDGYQVVTAPDGIAAIASFEKYKPALVILDIMMPGLDGFQVLNLIRLRSNVPAIMITAKWEMITTREKMGLSADDYLRKPFNIPELTALVRAKLKRVGQRES